MEVVAELVKYGANLDQTDSHGFSPLHYAASHGERSVHKLTYMLVVFSPFLSE
jgi:ankyrin repeat protein